ncbi:short-chain dehydrogenase [Actibacterium mucosum KCTC 23349]|uniref:Short-chain dehydrogenase n=1 Tax=Actibacterium mucosum KCTC 23349 TaxID=1454373 RepID=A0A037ZMY5_9RHOB|nr:SDR family oxidoreductase [Actibacterium mucosum]KAJ56206.1 short-chain dehydrogenase [Actibacterium mucosum KCTC 23349]
MSKFTNKTIFITGASRGIGAAAARFFAAGGAHVVLAARSIAALQSLATEIEGTGGQALAVACDVADYGQVDAAVAKAMDRFGSVDVLINNAGLIEPIARIEDSDPAAWAKVANVNLTGAYNALRAVLPGMVRRKTGTVINISSGAATGALEGWSHYCATKAGLLSLTRCADKELREKGIRVMGLSPGTVATEMQVQIRASGINPVSQLDPGVHKPVEWIAQALGYLAGDGGDAYLGTDFVLKTEEALREVGLPVS